MSRVDIIRSSFGRAFAVVAVAAMVVALTGQFLPASVNADGQVTNRSITMNSSAGAATGVTYTVKFTPATSITTPDIMVDFCSNDPLIGDSCTATAGTDVPNFSSAAASGWTVTPIGSNRGVILSSGGSVTAGTPITITITGVTNPSNVATSGDPSLGIFYGRILTYSTGGATGHTSASPGTYTDYGGTALTTTAGITITSKVFETLSYCVFQSSCGTAPDLKLGDATTGALSNTGAYVNSNAQYTIATNAANGASVAMRGTTLCRSSTPSNCNTGTTSIYTITGIGSSQAQSSTGNEQFGMCVDTTGATGSLTAQAPYDDGSGSAIHCHTGLTTGTYSGSSYFGFNDSTAAGGTNNSSGSSLMQATGPISSYTGTFAFLGNISATTEPGIYTTTLNTIATGLF